MEKEQHSPEISKDWAIIYIAIIVVVIQERIIFAICRILKGQQFFC